MGHIQFWRSYRVPASSQSTHIIENSVFTRQILTLSYFILFSILCIHKFIMSDLYSFFFSTFTILQHLAIWGNLLAFYIINLIVSAIPSSGMYTIMFRLCRQPSYWITMIVSLCSPIFCQTIFTLGSIWFGGETFSMENISEGKIQFKLDFLWFLKEILFYSQPQFIAFAWCSLVVLTETCMFQLIVVAGMGPILALKYFRFTYRPSKINLLQQAERLGGPILSLGNIEPQPRLIEKEVAPLSISHSKGRNQVFEPLLSDSPNYTRRSFGPGAPFDFFQSQGRLSSSYSRNCKNNWFCELECIAYQT